MSSLHGVIFSVQMSSNFLEWFETLMTQNGITNAEFARRGGVSESIISKVRNQERGIGFEFCQAVSKVFDIPLQNVYRKAGLLPSIEDNELGSEELIFLFRSLSIDGQKEILKYARFLLSEEKKLLQ